MAWLALNAETNIRQNEKIAGLERTSLPSDQRVTQNVFADSSAYGAMVREIDAALSAYRHIDQDGSLVENTCVMPVRKFAEAAHAASKAKDNSVVQLEKAETAVFGKVEFKKAFEFKPVIADIGSEVLDDPEGFQGETQFEEFKGQKNFKLHLATGYFRQVPITIGIGTRKKLYLIGTPSAFVIHFAGTTSTAEWQQGLVERYDSRE